MVNEDDFNRLSVLDKTNTLFDMLQFDAKQCSVMSIDELKITAPVVVVKIFEKIIGTSLDDHVDESALDSNADVVLRTLQSKHGLNKHITPSQLVHGDLIVLEQIIDNLYRLASKKFQFQSSGDQGNASNSPHRHSTREDEDTKKRVVNISNRFNTTYGSSLIEDLDNTQSFEEWLSSRDRDELERLQALREEKQRKAYEKYKLLKKKNESRRRRERELNDQRDRERELREQQLQREREREREYRRSLELDQKKARDRQRQQDQIQLNRQLQQQRDQEQQLRRERELQQERERRAQEDLDRKQLELKYQCDEEIRQQRERELQLKSDRERQKQREKELQALRDRELQQLRERELQLQKDKELQEEIDEKRRELQRQLDDELRQQREFEAQQRRDKEHQLQLDRELQQQRDMELQQQRERDVQMHRDLERKQELDRQRRELELQLEREKQLQLERELQLKRDQELRKQREEELRQLRDQELKQMKEKELQQQRDRKAQQDLERKRNELQLQLDRELQQQRDRELAMSRDNDLQLRLDKELQLLLDRERQLQLDRERHQQHDIELQQQLELERQKMLSEPIQVQPSTSQRSLHVVYEHLSGNSIDNESRGNSDDDSAVWKGWKDDGKRSRREQVPEDEPADESVEMRSSGRKEHKEVYCYDTYSGYRVKPRLLAQLIKKNNPDGLTDTTSSYGGSPAPLQSMYMTPTSTNGSAFASPSPMSGGKKHLDRTVYTGTAKPLACYKEMEPLDLLLTIEHSWKTNSGGKFKTEKEREISDHHTQVADHIFKCIVNMTYSVVKPHARLRVMRINAQRHRKKFDLENKEYGKHLEIQIAYMNNQGEVFPNLLFSRHKTRQWPSIKVLDKRIRAFYSRVNMQLHAIEGDDRYAAALLEEYPSYDRTHSFIHDTKKQKTPMIVDIFDARYLYKAQDDESFGEGFSADGEEEVINYRRV
mmetsp:Transcript_14991/g.24816  ORF Transcript_14991/g.24816 Transcript_14991/m.24816 type:complete len:948 (-) Transcript_14991:147-2990(-)